MKSAMRRMQWSQAWEFSDAVLAAHSTDADVIASVARVAHENAKPEIAAKLLAQACQVESFQNAPRVKQALIAAISIGKLNEGLELLEKAIAKEPLRHELRQLLFSLSVGTENRIDAVPHGRFLVRHRQFDLDLLVELSNTERRALDEKPLEEMISRNPHDKRPLMGSAKREFDKDKYGEAIRVLRSIITAHEDYLPARALLGRAFAATEQYEDLAKWAGQQPPAMQQHAAYWIAVGDWARAKQDFESAARAYWESTRCDADVVEAWSKLSIMMGQLTNTGTEFPQEVRDAIERRTSLLSSFAQLKDRFNRSGSISRAVGIDIVKTLRDLGRLWEAEAWASIALNLPEDDEADVQGIRDAIVKTLTQETPWQLIEGHREFDLDLTHFPVPSVCQRDSRSDRDSVPQSGVPASSQSQRTRESGSIRLLNEASHRGLQFFGRTSDTLHQPGISLHETLGCGGGTIDFDLDGWNDLYLAAAGGTPSQRDSAKNAFMRNIEGQFSDITIETQTGDPGFGQGVAIGDVNEDGFPDLLVLNYGPDALLINQGDGTFADASTRLPCGNTDWSTSGAIADFDSDGISDMVVLHYCDGLEPSRVQREPNQEGVHSSFSPMKFPGLRDQFLQGTRAGEWLDRTDAWGASPTIIGRGLGVVVGSLDGDPGLDIYMTNDMTNNH